MDVAASLINLFAVRYSLMPADDEHASATAGGIAAGWHSHVHRRLALFLMLHAVDRLLNPQPCSRSASASA